MYVRVGRWEAASRAVAARAYAGTAPDEGLSREVKIVAGVIVLGVTMSTLDTTIVEAGSPYSESP